MDLDDYFTGGPSEAFCRHDVFTDRRHHLDSFIARVRAHSARRFTVAEYVDFPRRAAANVTAIYGDGGIGKTTLLDQVCESFRALDSDDLPRRRTAVVVDFADTINHSFETVVLRLRAAFASLGSRWPAFDTALAAYWERSHPGVRLDSFVRKTRILQPEQRAVFAEQAVDVLDNFVGGMGLIGGGVKAVGAIGKAIRQSAAVRELTREFPPFERVIDESHPDKMLTYLPVLLGWDLERLRREHGAEAVVLFDTFETVQALPPERGLLEDLLARTVFLLPNVLFIVASRRPLRWHDPVRAVGLQYGGPARWPGLAGTPPRDLVRINGLASRDGDEYLRSRLTDAEGNPAIPEEIRERVLAGAGGSPLYLDLSVTLFASLTTGGATVDPDQFGKPFPELVLRIVRDLTAGERDLLRAASLLQAFDADILAATLPNTRGREIERFLTKSFVRQHDDAWPRYRLHENLRRGVLAGDHYTDDGWTDDERTERLDRALGRLIDVGLTVWDDEQDAVVAAEKSRRAVTALLVTLRAAIEHRWPPKRLELLAYTVSQLGHWQVLAALPQAEGADPPLRRLVEVARVAGDGATDATARYTAARTVAALPHAGGQSHPYDAYLQYELAQLAQIIGAFDDCGHYYHALQSAPPPLNDAAPWGLAGVALAQSRQDEALRYAERMARSDLDRTRITDLSGHIYLQGGDFQRAADLFGETLTYAHAAGAPLWMAAALRHRALALMWIEPEAAREVLPQARELNAALANTIGLAQCDLAASVVAAGTGDFDGARRLLVSARQRAMEMGTGEPVDLAEALICAALGEAEGAVAAARRLIRQVHAADPIIPAWAAVAAMWVGRPDLYDFDSIGWYDSAAAARQRWMRPYERMHALAAG